MVNWLPDWKSSLNEAFVNHVKTPLENKANEFKQLASENLENGKRTQQALLAIALAIFLLLAIAYFWRGNSKYLAIGILTGYLLPCFYYLTQNNKSLLNPLTRSNSEKETNIA